MTIAYLTTDAKIHILPRIADRRYKNPVSIAFATARKAGLVCRHGETPNHVMRWEIAGGIAGDCWASCSRHLAEVDRVAKLAGLENLDSRLVAA